MPGYVIHVAIAQEYMRKHNNKKENYQEFVKGVIMPDLIRPKSESHYGESPAYTNLKKFLNNNSIDNSLNRGKFLHLIADYLFYNFYLENFSKEYIYNDYDILNMSLIEKYNVELPEIAKDSVFFKEGKTKVLSLELAHKVIDEISELDIDNVKVEVLNDDKKWNTYKNLI